MPPSGEVTAEKSSTVAKLPTQNEVLQEKNVQFTEKSEPNYVLKRTNDPVERV